MKFFLAMVMSALVGAGSASLYQSTSGFAFQSTAANCWNNTAQTNGNWLARWLDSHGNVAGGVDCGGDVYVLGNQGPYVQLGMPQEGDVSIAGGFMASANAGGSPGQGYEGMTSDHTKTVAGVHCSGPLFFYTSVAGANRFLGCFDLNGNLGIAGKVYAAQ